MVESAENKHKNAYDGDNLTSGQQKNDTEEYNNLLIETASYYSEGSISSIGSASSTDLQEHDDVSSSSTTISFVSSSSTSGHPPDLSELMSDCPIKRGLSRFYHGKSESFMSLSSGRSVEDLPKKVTAFKRSRHKLCSNRRFSKAGRSLSHP